MIKLVKKLSCVLIVIAVLFSFTSCNGNGKTINMEIYSATNNQKNTIIKTLESSKDINYYLEVVNNYTKTELKEFPEKSNFVIYSKGALENGDDLEYLFCVTDKEVYFKISQGASDGVENDIFLSNKDKEYFLAPMLG